MNDSNNRFLANSIAGGALALLLLATAMLAPVGVEAQTADPGLGLVGLPYANDIERAARAGFRAARAAP